MKNPLRRRTPGVPRTAMHATLAPAAAQIVRNLLVTHDGTVWAGYRLGAVRWDFTDMADKALLLEAVADGWATLLGRLSVERVTTRPHPVTEWARRLDARTPRPVGGRAAWDEHVSRMAYRISQAGMDDKIVYRLFTVGAVEPGTDVMAEVIAFYRDGTRPSDDVREVLADEKRVFDAVRGPGWGARRMTERDAGWLRMRSLAPGVPAPLIDSPGWDAADMDAFSNDTRWHETAFDRQVEVTAWRAGQKITRRVQVLTAARMDDLTYPESGLEPWQAYVERATDPDGLSFGAEWLMAGRLCTGGELQHRAELDYNKAKSIKESYHAFEEDPPAYTGRGIDVANEARDQISTGRAVVSGRYDGTVNILVSGADVLDERGRISKTAEEVVEERADAIRRLYGGSDLRMDFTAPHGQAARLREFVPGEPFDRVGYQRQIRLPFLAAGLPNVSANVGDGRGPYIGYTRGAARRAVMHDPHFATEGRGELGRGANFWLVVATLGGGKSVLLGAAIAYQAAKRGITCVIRDPSGPLAALCRMPELAKDSLEINLLNGRRGILNPPSLVREPMAEEFQDQGLLENMEAHDEAVSEAKAERRGLVIDTARRCLDFDLYSHPRTVEMLRKAADRVAAARGWLIDSTLWDLVDELEREDDPHADAVASALVAAAEMPIMRLLFPPRAAAFGGERADQVSLLTTGKVLTVITTPGVKRATDATHRSDWSARELAADAILRLTSLLTDRILFSKPMGERAIAVFDEAEDMTDTGSGRAYFDRLGRDHSKWNIGVYLGLKNVTDQMMGGELKNFIAGAFVGRMSSSAPEAADAMLSLLRVTDKRYARTLMGLSTYQAGEFVHLDAEGNVGAFKVDVEHHPELKAALLTNPENEGSSAWALTEEAMA